MTNDDYHADTSAISASGLKLFMRSPAHYYAAYLDRTALSAALHRPCASGQQRTARYRA